MDNNYGLDDLPYNTLFMCFITQDHTHFNLTHASIFFFLTLALIFSKDMLFEQSSKIRHDLLNIMGFF